MRQSISRLLRRGGWRYSYSSFSCRIETILSHAGGTGTAMTRRMLSIEKGAMSDVLDSNLKRVASPRISNILSLPDIEQQVVKVQGWVRTKRTQKNVIFLQINDGSNLEGIQAVWTNCSVTGGDDEIMNSVTNGDAVAVIGRMTPSMGNKQGFELQVEQIDIVGDCDASTYPLQKKRHSLEFLRQISHLRGRTNTFGAVARVRSTLSYATHTFFQELDFLHLHTPIITSSDCEGAGEMFRVSSLPVAVSEEPPTQNLSDEKDFFGRAAYLTVSGQLAAESYACSVGNVYTFGPTFRAENSNTSRHLAEFNMIEPEMVFCCLNDLMDNAESFVKHVVSSALEKRKDDVGFFNRFYDRTIFDRMSALVERPFVRISYRKAIEMLQEEIEKDPSQWKFPNVEFGTDLANEHEKWLCDNPIFGSSCVFVFDYPRTLKSFYMRNNDDGETVAAFDLLVPGVGELIGGSMREERLDQLIEKITEKNMDVDSYQWYLDTRRYGSVPHGGYGVGFERLVCLVTGMSNIRDAVAFPRVPGNCFP